MHMLLPRGFSPTNKATLPTEYSLALGHDSPAGTVIPFSKLVDVLSQLAPTSLPVMFNDRLSRQIEVIYYWDIDKGNPE
jgi:hypothetical protein